MPDSTRNIVVCCDGTANEPRACGSTNVFELVRVMRGQPDQIIYYDPGLGTESAPGVQLPMVKSITKLLGLAVGYGLQKNIADAYRFIMKHYTPGDRLYLVGFSRGAYTVRALAGMLHDFGLLEPGADNLVSYAVRKYMKQGKREWDNNAAFKGTLCQRICETSPHYSVPVHFLGVWDTVKSVGLFRRSVRLPYTKLLPNVASGRHAVALGEKRSKYRPDIWGAKGATNGDVQTVWFNGVHADVGGGYPSNERGLADVALRWMMDGAERHGLGIDRTCFEKGCETRLNKVRKALPNPGENADTDALCAYEKVHNPLIPLWWIMLWWRRALPERAWIHESVIEAIVCDDTRYRYPPLDTLHRLGDKTVHHEDDMLLLRHSGAVLIQRLTKEETAYIESAGLNQDSAKVMSTLYAAGLAAWRDSLQAQLKSGELTLNDAPRAKATQLLEEAAAALEQDRVKGEDGAFARVCEFRRMNSLRSKGNVRARTRIVASAPYLAEALAEYPAQ